MILCDCYHVLVSAAHLEFSLEASASASASAATDILFVVNGMSEEI